MNEIIFKELRARIIEHIDVTKDITNEELLEIIDNAVTEDRSKRFISLSDRSLLRKKLYRSIRGLDILDDFLEDDSISEIMVNGYDNIFIERNGCLTKTDMTFSSPQKLLDIIQQIVSVSNRRVNLSSPIVDTRLSDGSRVNVVLDPISIDGPALTIRRFPDTPLTMDDLINLNTITKEAADFLNILVRCGYNIFISGGTGSGKTTFLNVLSGFIPSYERVITIEDSAELRLIHIDNLIRLEARQANTEGGNEVSIRDLIKSALRMNPRPRTIKKRKK